MENDDNIPDAIREAFPMISGGAFIRRLSSPVPLTPDTTFDIYSKGTEDFIALVTTDHVDPQYQSQELKSISGQYEFEFINLVKPYSDSGETIKVLDNDDMEGDFFVTTPHKSYHLYCYLANLKING